MEKRKLPMTLLVTEVIRAIMQGLMYALTFGAFGFLIGRLSGSGRAWGYSLSFLLVLPFFWVPIRLSALRINRRISFLSKDGFGIASVAGAWGFCIGLVFVAFLAEFRGLAATLQDYLLTGLCTAGVAAVLCALPACQRRVS